MQKAYKLLGNNINMGHYQIVIPESNEEAKSALADYLDKNKVQILACATSRFWVNLPQIRSLDDLREVMLGVHSGIKCYIGRVGRARDLF